MRGAGSPDPGRMFTPPPLPRARGGIYMQGFLCIRPAPWKSSFLNGNVHRESLALYPSTVTRLARSFKRLAQANNLGGGTDPPPSWGCLQPRVRGGPGAPGDPAVPVHRRRDVVPRRQRAARRGPTSRQRRQAEIAPPPLSIGPKFA